MSDPQEGVRRGMWMSHDGLVWIEDMSDEYLLNCYRTCLRRDNPKADEIWRELERRDIEWRIK